MTLRHLEVFVEVRKLESITGAADNLNMAQPAVSRIVRELESYYGVKLFERMNRKLYITEAGEQLFSYADMIVSQYYEARDVLRDRELTVKLRIGSNISCAQRLIPELLRKFGVEYPSIPVYLKVANSQEIENELLLNELDFGFIDVPLQPEHYIYRKFMEDRVLFVCAKDYPIGETVSFEQVRKQPLLTRETGSGSRRLLEQLFEQEGVRPNIVMESSDIYSLQEMCRSGFGLLALTESMVGRWVQGSAFRIVRPGWNHGNRSYCFTHHKSKYLTKSMRYFKEYVEKNYMEMNCEKVLKNRLTGNG